VKQTRELTEIETIRGVSVVLPGLSSPALINVLKMFYSEISPHIVKEKRNMQLFWFSVVDLWGNPPTRKVQIRRT
jgi:hypothetical protein